MCNCYAFLSHQMLTPRVLTDYDATSAFDRVLAGLLTVTCQRLVLPRAAGNFMFNLLNEMSFYLVTGFGQLANSFCNNHQDGISGQGTAWKYRDSLELPVLLCSIY